MFFGKIIEGVYFENLAKCCCILQKGHQLPVLCLLKLADFYNCFQIRHLLWIADIKQESDDYVTVQEYTIIGRCSRTAQMRTFKPNQFVWTLIIYERKCFQIKRINIDRRIFCLLSLNCLTNEKNCNFVLWVGNKRLIKKKLFDKYIEQTYSI